ncbi:alpha/beta hydrolase family protein [Micromonospora pisi]|uniref:Alpha/beta hydrolase family protein n=1 Tax=Micromonospora pisi TaxID=589240 RepID=A0A495JNB8_9ACTN|nr:alpha/beta hydrolase [Micromonospora pisi]RKR90135.1 alpha/beta hydrolase family protein [Micromonospora pisi]
MIGYAQLWSADPAAWRAAGATWRGVAGLTDRRVAEVTGTAAELRAGWAGPAGQAADRRLHGLASELVGSRPVFIEVEQILTEYAARISTAKAMLDATVRDAASRGVRVDRRGVASADPAAQPDRRDPTATRQPGGPEPAAVPEIAAGIAAALELATTADREAARRLADLAAGAGAGWATAPPAGPPPPGSDPAVVRRWWAGLTPAQRRWLVAHEPALVGRLDGVPVGDRDQANRLLLERQRGTLLAERSALLSGRITPAVAVELARIERTLAGFDVLGDRLVADTGPRAYLLGLDPAGDGRAVVALGDPDQAENVLTYVPGMTTDLPTIAGELGRAELMAARCADLAPTERTAVVLWLDYDAPDFLDQALHPRQAHDAGPALHSFQEGLRATHEGPPARQTVLGHSYGSLVVGTTARDHGIAADQVVFIGSPGVGVDRAADLHLPPDRVWAGTAGDDVIRHAAGPVELLGRLAVSGVLPGVGAMIAWGRPAEDLWFGADPSGADFGARVFGAGTDGHTGYWNAGNPALDSIARITLDGRAR